MTVQSAAPEIINLPKNPAVTSWGDEFRAMFSLAWPLVIAQVAQNALVTTDVILVGRLGAQQLAGIALASAFIMPFLLLGSGIVGAVAPLVAQARGARDIKAVRRIVRQGFWASILLSVLLIAFIWQIGPIFRLLGQDPVATALAQEYTHVAAFMFIPAMAIYPIRSLLSAFDATRIILVITMGGVVANAALAYTLIFGHFGFPAMGLSGAGLATVIVYTLMFLAMLAFVLLDRRFRRFHILHNFWKPDWGHFIALFRIGTPIGLTVLAEVGLFTAAALLMGRLGTDEVAAHAIALQCAAMAFMVPLGIGIACSVRVGIAYGRGNSDGVRKAGWTAMAVGVGFMVLSASCFLLFADAIVGLFLDRTDPANVNVLALAVGFLAVAGLFQVVDGAQVVAAHALRGLNDTAIPMVIAIFGYWAVGLPIAYYFGFVLEWRGIGIWIGLAAGLAFVAAVLVVRFVWRERLGLMRPRLLAQTPANRS